MTTRVVGARFVLATEGDAQVLLEDAYVYLDGDRIEAVTRDPPAPGDDLRHHEHGLLLPGFVNLHSHCMNGALYRGIPDDLPLDPWVTELIYKVLMPLGQIAARELDPDDLRAVTTLGLVDVLKGGSTTVLDMWRHGQEVFFDVAREIGVRVVGAPYVMSTSRLGMGPDRRPFYEFEGDGRGTLERAIDLFRRFDEGPSGMIRVALGPHGADTCLPALLREVRQAAEDLDCIVTTHLAQTPEELVFLRERYGKGPVEYLDDVGLLGDHVILAHCVHATDDEIARIRATGTSVANCPISFAREGTSVPFGRFSEAGVRTGLGTDSHGMNFISEMRTAGFLSKLHFQKAHVATAHDLIRAATMTGADALRRPDLGRIEPGAKADLLVVDLHKPHLQPVWNPLKNLVWKGSGSDIDTIIVNGRTVVERGKLLSADEDAIIAAAATAARKMWEVATREGILDLV